MTDSHTASTSRQSGWPLVGATQLAAATFGALGTVALNFAIAARADAGEARLLDLYLNLVWEVSLWPAYRLYNLMGFPWRMHASRTVPWRELVAAAFINSMLLFLVVTVLRLICALFMKNAKEA